MTGKILFVDDEKEMLSSFKRLFIDYNCLVYTASSGAEALDLLKKESIDVVVSDQRMPEMCGIELLEHVKKSFPDIIRILITGYSDNKATVDSINRCEIFRYIEKPWNNHELKNTIKLAFELKKLREDNCNLLKLTERQNIELKALNKELGEKVKLHINLCNLQKKLHKELTTNYEALKKAEKARDTMCHMIVHDLRNPLGIIKGCVQLLESRINDTANKTISIILETIERMVVLLNSILYVSKLESEEINVSLKSINIAQLINDISNEYIPQAEKKRISLSVDCDSNEIIANADKALMPRILENLVNNSLKYSKSYIKISAKKQKDSVIICVSDDGPGIPEKHKEDIFERFFQIDDCPERKRSGVGLGLAFCKTAVKAQNGSIWVESREGKGSSFKIKFKI